MGRRFCITLAITLALGFLMLENAANAYIQTQVTMRDVLKQTQLIFTANVESFNPEKRTAVLTVEESLKGKVIFKKLHIALPQDKEGSREFNRPSHLLKRLAVKQTVVFFADSREGAFAPIRRGNIILFLYTNGTWAQFAAETKEDGPPNLPISFHHFEPYLQRTFKGTTSEMRQVIVDGLSGKKDPPAYNAKEPGGLGPEVSSK